MAFNGSYVDADGVWRSRAVDVQRALNANSLEEPEQPSNMEPRRAVSMGLLSRTIVRSPLIKWILPARVRHANKNDVIFVGEDFIHIKEVQHGGQLLKHVGTKADFGCSIRSAQVLGERRQLDVDTPVKVEPGDDTEMGGAQETEAAIPPQLLVLCLANQDVVFLFVRDRPGGGVSFCTTREPLPKMASDLEAPGAFLAVDPNSQALAAAAYDGNIMMISTAPVADCGAKTESWSPVTDCRMLRVDGIILSVEFLFSDPNDKDCVILIVLHNHDEKLKLTCFFWDGARDLETVDRRLDGFPLREGSCIPQLVIPLRRFSAFILATADNRFFKYHNILTGVPMAGNIAAPNPENPKNPPDPAARPRLWTHWTRMGRNWQLKGNDQENFYLVREDGATNYLQANSSFEVSTFTSSRAVNFDCSVDKAFASLEVGWSLQEPDVLVACSTAGTGKVIRIGPWSGYNPPRVMTRGEQMAAVTEFTMPNWAPAMDGVVAKPPDAEAQMGGGKTPSLYVTSGREPYGAVSELRCGCEVKLISYLDEDCGLAGANRIFYFPELARGGYRFMVAMPTSTALIQLNSEFDDFEYLDSNQWEANADSETLAAGLLRDNRGVQVTRESVVVFNLATDANNTLRRTAGAQVAPGQRFVHAALLPDQGLVVCARRDGEATDVCAFAYDPETDTLTDVGSVFPLPGEPTCLAAFALRGNPHACVSCGDGSLLVLEFDPCGKQIAERELRTAPLPDGTGAHSVFESVVSATTPSSDGELLLLCGTRDGRIRVFREGDWSEMLTASVKVGDMPVKLIPDEPGRAFALCGGETCRVTIPGDGESALVVHSMWIGDSISRPSYQQPSIDSLCRFDYAKYTNNPKHTNNRHPAVACVHPSGLLIGSLDDEVKCIPRSLNLDLWSPADQEDGPNGTPYGLFPLEKLNLTAVATQKSMLREGNQPKRAARHIILHTLTLRGTVAEGSNVEEVFGSFELDPRERVKVVSEWVYQNSDSKRYGHVIVGTEIAVGGAEKRGRLLILKCTTFGGRVSLTESRTKSLSAPVYAACMWDDLTLMYCVEKRLRVERFVITEKKWIKFREHILPSIGTRISAVGDYIYVTTLRHSVQVLKVSTDPDGTVAVKEEHNDGRERYPNTHLAVPLPAGGDNSRHRWSALILVSDKLGPLAGILHPNERMISSGMPIVFEARPPRKFTRLWRGDVRPPWTRETCPRPRVLYDDIIGFASDGTVCTLFVLDKRATLFLRLLENLFRAISQPKRSNPTMSAIADSLDAVENGFGHDPFAPDNSDDVEMTLDDRGTTKEPPLALRDVDPASGFALPRRDRSTLARPLRNGNLPPAAGSTLRGEPHPANMHVDGDFLLSALDGAHGDPAHELANLLADGQRAEPEVWELLRRRARAALCEAADGGGCGDGDKADGMMTNGHRGGEGGWKGMWMDARELDDGDGGVESVEQRQRREMRAILAWTKRLYLGAYL